MRQLSAQTAESVSFYVPRLDVDPPVRVCLFRVDAPRSVRDHLAVGDRLPLDRGSTGRLMRAFLDEAPRRADEAIRAERVHASWGDRDPEICGVSAPVLGPRGRLVGALTLSAPTARRDRAWTEAMKPLVRSVADRATRALGFAPPAARAGREATR
jgi:DNA-binding IclR family transcriptional regulator